MIIPRLEALLARFQALGAQRVLCKRLAENDNSKQQVYLGHGFDALNLVPFDAVQSDSSKKQPIMKAALALSWLDDRGAYLPRNGCAAGALPAVPGSADVGLPARLRDGTKRTDAANAEGFAAIQ